MDYAKLRENLSLFYDFSDNVVLYVGAAGRQVLGPAIRIKKLIAIDRNVDAVRELQANITVQGRPWFVAGA